MTPPLRAGSDQPAQAKGSSRPGPVLPREVFRQPWARSKYISPDGHPDMTVALVSLVRRDADATSIRAVGRRLGLDYSAIARWFSDGLMPSGDAINAIVAAYGLRAVVDEMQALRERTRDRAYSVTDRIRALPTADVTAFSDTADLVYREDVLAIVEGRG